VLHDEPVEAKRQPVDIREPRLWKDANGSESLCLADTFYAVRMGREVVVNKRQRNGARGERTPNASEMRTVELFCEPLMLAYRRRAPRDQVMGLKGAPEIRIDDCVRNQHDHIIWSSSRSEAPGLTAKCGATHVPRA